MENFKTKIYMEGDKEYSFECYDNTEPIEVGDVFIYFLMGIADVQVCATEKEKYEINPNDRVLDSSKIDLVTGFWRNCYKIKKTDFDLSKVE